MLTWPFNCCVHSKHTVCRSRLFVQVTYDDGEIELGVEACRLRKPDEAHRGAMGGARAATGPDWKHPAVRPATGVRVAVHGYSEAQVSKLVVGMIGGMKSGSRRWRL